MRGLNATCLDFILWEVRDSLKILNGVFRGLLTCQPCATSLVQKRESKAEGPRRLLLWSRYGVCLTQGGGRRKKLQRENLCDLSTGYSEKKW